MASQRESSDFSTDVAESAFLGAGWLGDDSQKINCLYLCLPLLMQFYLFCLLLPCDLFLFHLLLSLILYTPPFPSSHPWPVSSFCCFSYLQHHPCISPLPLHVLNKIRSPESDPLHFVNIWAILLGCISRSDFRWLMDNANKEHFSNKFT